MNTTILETRTKICKICGIEKYNTDFYFQKKYEKIYISSWCKKCKAVRANERWRRKHPEKKVKDGMKFCKKCGTEKQKNDFYFRYGKPHSPCKKCHAATSKAYIEKNIVHVRARKAKSNKKWRLLKLYGLTQKEVDEIFAGQGSCCAICKRAEPGWDRGWCIDHNHETKVVRGILCNNCNKMIGLAREIPEVMRSGALYCETKNG